jgi:branched-chain amino acid transport system permease protein
MDLLAQQIINGILLGATYALIALGFTLIFGIMNVLNLAQSEMLTWGAFVAYVLNQYLNLEFALVLPIVILAIGALGIIIERLAIRPIINPFKEAEPLSPLISTIGVGMVLQNLAIRIFEPKGMAFPLSIGTGGMDVLGIYIAWNKFVGFLISIGFMCILMIVLYRTNLGKKIRATAEDPKAAMSLGVNVYPIFSIVMAISAVLGGVAGLLLSSIYGLISPFIGLNYGLKGLVVMIIGGVSSLSGSVVGGILLGILEALTIGYISSAYVDVVTFGIIVVILIIRPQGLLPSFK